MPTTDKLITVAENVPKVYHAGQFNVIENTSTLKKSASGSAILIDDVSPVTHDMSVKISSIPKKNLLNRLIAKAYSSDMSVPTEDFINTYCSKKISFKQGTTYTFSIKSVSGFSGNVAWAPKFYIFDNGSLFVSNATSPPVVFSTDFFTSDSSANEYVCSNGTALWNKNNMIGNQGPWSMTITPVKDFEAVFIVTDGNVTDSIIVTEAQIEVGSTATSYAPYIENPVTDLTAVKVSRCGKNLLPLADSGIYYKGTIAGGAPIIYNSSFVISNFNNIDMSLYKGVYAVIKLTENETYTLTVNNLVNNCATKQIRFTVGFRSSESTIFGTSEKDGTYSAYNQPSFTFTVPNGYPYCLVGFYNYPTVSGDTVSFDAMQLEYGPTATEYEPYITPTDYTPNADGTVNGVTSLYPSTILITDTEGVIIDCEYYKDIDVDDIIERTATTYTNPKVKIIGDYAFYNYSALTTINFPIATSIGNSAFFSCISLTTANVPVATSIGNNAFYYCSALTTADFPIATSIENNAFYGCTSLTTINFPVATSVGGSAFYNCKSLISSDFPIATSVGGSAFYNCKSLISSDFPIATSIKNNAFYGCTSLTTINFPVATSVGSSAFRNCKALTTINFPVATSIENNTFYDCTSLTTINFPVATSVGNRAFYGCSELTALILRNSTICTLSNTNAFTGCTKITGTGGYIYVPSSLVDAYKTATNWVTYASKFRALEDYTVDGTTTGALDESKVSA